MLQGWSSKLVFQISCTVPSLALLISSTTEVERQTEKQSLHMHHARATGTKSCHPQTHTDAQIKFRSAQLNQEKSRQNVIVCTYCEFLSAEFLADESSWLRGLSKASFLGPHQAKPPSNKSFLSIHLQPCRILFALRVYQRLNPRALGKVILHEYTHTHTQTSRPFASKMCGVMAPWVRAPPNPGGFVVSQQIVCCSPFCLFVALFRKKRTPHTRAKAPRVCKLNNGTLLWLTIREMDFSVNTKSTSRPRKHCR